MIARPDPSEHHEYYSAYIDLVPDGNLVEMLRANIQQTTALLGGLSEADADARYAPGKWSVKEVVAHLVDSERTFAFRAFWFARGGPGELAGFEQDDFVATSSADSRSLASWLDELTAVRAGTVALFASMSEEVTSRTGIASGFSFTVRALAYITAGHELHHRNVLRERYKIG